MPSPPSPNSGATRPIAAAATRAVQEAASVVAAAAGAPPATGKSPAPAPDQKFPSIFPTAEEWIKFVGTLANGGEAARNRRKKLEDLLSEMATEKCRTRAEVAQEHQTRPNQKKP